MGVEKMAVRYPKLQVSTPPVTKSYGYYFEFEFRVFLILLFLLCIAKWVAGRLKMYTPAVIFIFGILARF